ncbi:Probable S-adenosylmethionine-dependent methyltransferase MSMEG_2350 [Serratia grimesii]|uniref:class I SAM-dependent methyltransferase n=1 Tax=Serratia grimesii TaxID=82995 RepID=UPI0021778C8A|nr:class I SAM-dependent methyltransferase [Serratia grimesii]CAI1515942.1 Probable S-adenosylmethionine-dependent methyltransferase MSMEG_2350 [Serratia grimesii]
MKDSFYSSFENKHRGSRESIKERLNVYLPFITPFKNIYPGETVLDLGCGRGEWLELMQSLEFDGKGIDLDEGMLSYCHDLGLNVEKGDVISFLQNIPDESVAIVSSFHLVEHIGFDNVKRLVEESFRVLKPGGLLIMETPNPENIIVSTNNFYLDPTHVTPIPSLLLSFLTEHQGFERSKLLRLQEDKNISVKEDIQIIDVLGGVSPDYSVIAQKKGGLATLSLLDEAFNSNYGIGLQELSTKFHQYIEKSFKSRDEKIDKLDETIEKLNLLEYDSHMIKITKLENEFLENQKNNEFIKIQKDSAFDKLSERFLAHLEKENAELKLNLSELNNSLGKELEDHANTKNRLNLVYASTSWKLTSPVRALSSVLRWCVKPVKLNGFNNFLPRLKGYIKRKCICFVKRLINVLNRKPKLKGVMLKTINKLGLYDYAKKLYYKSNSQRVSPNPQSGFSNSESELSPKARVIYEALKKKSSSDSMRNQ